MHLINFKKIESILKELKLMILYENCKCEEEFNLFIIFVFLNFVCCSESGIGLVISHLPTDLANSYHILARHLPGLNIFPISIIGFLCP